MRKGISAAAHISYSAAVSADIEHGVWVRNATLAGDGDVLLGPASGSGR